MNIVNFIVAILLITHPVSSFVFQISLQGCIRLWKHSGYIIFIQMKASVLILNCIFKYFWVVNIISWSSCSWRCNRQHLVIALLLANILLILIFILLKIVIINDMWWYSKIPQKIIFCYPLLNLLELIIFRCILKILNFNLISVAISCKSIILLLQHFLC